MKTLLTYLLTFTLLTACAPTTPAEPQPPEIIYGQTVCEACGMIIDDARFAAAFVTPEGTAHTFESIGDMVVWQMDHPNAEVRAWFVHDYTTSSWMRAETAFYVLSDQLQPPMPPGLAAFTDRATAEQFAQAHAGQILTFDEARVTIHLVAHG